MPDLQWSINLLNICQLLIKFKELPINLTKILYLTTDLKLKNAWFNSS